MDQGVRCLKKTAPCKGRGAVETKDQTRAAFYGEVEGCVNMKCKDKLPEVEFSLLLQVGEGQHIEFKESANASLAKEFVAFANAEGGRVIVGVNDANCVVGVNVSNRFIAQTEDVARNCDPSVHLSISKFRFKEKDILIIDIPEGDKKPYSCSEGYYLRVGTCSQKMRRDELLEFVRRVQLFCFDEQICHDFSYPKDFDAKAFGLFLGRAGIVQEGLKREDILYNLGVATRKGKKILFNNAGVLFFAKAPVKFIRHAKTTCLLLAGTDKVHILDRKDLEENLPANVEQTMIFLKRHLSLRYKIEKLQREEILELPETALREAVLNAVSHRDYHERGAVVMVEVYRDRVEISDPGGLPPGLKRSELGHKSVHRNPLIADLFHRMGEVEKVGSGIKRMREAAKAAGVPAPQFEATGFFTITYRKPAKAKELESQPESPTQSPTQSTDPVERLLSIFQQKELSAGELRLALGIKHRPTFRENYLHPALEKGLIEYTIPDKPNSRLQKYRVTEKGGKGPF